MTQGGGILHDHHEEGDDPIQFHPFMPPKVVLELAHQHPCHHASQ
jgi:hypothetical protein